MTRRGIGLGLALLFAAVAVIAPTGLAARASVFHIVLDKSAPDDGEAVANEVTEIRLFFSDAPLMRGASIRVVTSGRSLMRSTPPAPDPEDPRQVAVQMNPPLPPGAYVVLWRCIADDGHVMRGDFTFEVTGE
jgi:methionine-rich copper-binding protein CopC